MLARKAFHGIISVIGKPNTLEIQGS